MDGELKRAAMELGEMDNVHSVWDLVDARMSSGDEGIVDFALAIHQLYAPTATTTWQFRSVFDRIRRLLALTPGAGNVTGALRLIVETGSIRGQGTRRMASLLAAGQKPEDLAQAFDGPAQLDELRECLLQEMVLRGQDVCSIPTIRAWMDTPRTHPLVWLPPVLVDIDANPALPFYYPDGMSVEVPVWTRRAQQAAIAPEPPKTAAATPDIVEATSAAFSQAAASAVQTWIDGSNGKAEAREFLANRPTTTGEWAALVSGLPLDCLAGDAESTTHEASAQTVWQILFAAASEGGAHSSGLFGAYGRLAAWTSMRALAGVAMAANFSHVARRVRDSHWIQLETSGSWFGHAAWDIAVLCLGPARDRLALLAATDTY